MKSESKSPRRAIPGWLRGLALLLVIGLLVYSARNRQPAGPVADNRPPAVDNSSDDRIPQPEPEVPSSTQTTIDGQTIRGLDGEVVFRGQIDVSQTLQRIDSDERLPFPNDGASFQNRERRLPAQRSGYYREWVHPTPGLRGPGPQRIVTGSRGEIYYTPDHYRTFRRLDGG